jgi:hypothetical protein
VHEVHLTWVQKFFHIERVKVRLGIDTLSSLSKKRSAIQCKNILHPGPVVPQVMLASRCRTRLPILTVHHPKLV